MDTAKRGPAPRVEEVEQWLDGIAGTLVRAWRTLLGLLLLAVVVWLVLAPILDAWALLPIVAAVAWLVVVPAWTRAHGPVQWLLPGESGVGFADYRGNPEALAMGRRLVTLLRAGPALAALGAGVPRGVLLLGPAGVGKSHLARCIATEAGAPLGYLSAPTLQPAHLDAAFRQAHALAARYGSCVLYVADIHTLGDAGLRHALLTRIAPPLGLPWRERTLRRLGIDRPPPPPPPVLTLASAPHVADVDPALLGAGRFDRTLAIAPPDVAGREAIIAYSLDRVPHEPLSIDQLARETLGYTPAALRALVNEAVISAHLAGRVRCDYSDWRFALAHLDVGPRPPLPRLATEAGWRLAVHVAGSAVARALLHPAGRSGKVTLSPPDPTHPRALPRLPNPAASREEVFTELRTLLASRAAEEVCLGTQTTGVAGDLREATVLAEWVIGAWGMAGAGRTGVTSSPTSDATHRDRVEALLHEQLTEVRRLLTGRRDAVIAVAEALRLRLELTPDEIDAIIARTSRRP